MFKVSIVGVNLVFALLLNHNKTGSVPCFVSKLIVDSTPRVWYAESYTICNFLHTCAMQPIKQLANILAALADSDHYLFTLSDLKCAIPEHSQGAFRAMLSRCVTTGLLERICYGLYLYPPAVQDTSSLLFHAAAKLRAHCFNYLSLETVLTDAGIISQIPMNWITLMSSCRSQTINCNRFGHIEFIHTKKRPADVAEFLTYDPRCRLWRASIDLAIKDMRVTGRSTDLMEPPDEPV